MHYGAIYTVMDLRASWGMVVIRVRQAGQDRHPRMSSPACETCRDGTSSRGHRPSNKQSARHPCLRTTACRPTQNVSDDTLPFVPFSLAPALTPPSADRPSFPPATAPARHQHKPLRVLSLDPLPSPQSLPHRYSGSTIPLGLIGVPGSGPGAC